MPPFPGDTADFIDVSGRILHYRHVRPDLRETPLVFLHEGLGSVDLWRDLPAGVVEACGHPAFVYSRYGNGWSAPLTEPRHPGYMHDEALHTLPEIVERVLGRPPILVGHSDGASIALIYAGAGHTAEGLVLLAPHVFVEPETLAAIASVREEFPASDMPGKMAKYHLEPETTFRGWADVWLSPEFRSWNIEEYLSGVRCPILLIQGDADEYGTTRQLDVIAAAASMPVETLMVPGAGHSPHLSHPDLVITAVADFVARLG